MRVGGVEVAGTFPGFRSETAALLASLTGKRVTVARIYEAADALEHAYSAAGYFLARVVVPPQKLVDGGTLHLTVIDGFIERVDVKDVPARQRREVAARMAAVVGEHHLMLAEIERRLLLVSDIPGLRLRSTLAGGNTPGGTLLVLQATQSYATGTIGFDDRLPASLGPWAINASAALNSVLGFGEQAYASAQSSPDVGPARLRLIGGGVTLPIGPDGFSVNPEYTKSMARPTPAAGTPATTGDFERFALRASYPVIRTRTGNLALQASLEWINENLAPIGFTTDFYRDDYQAARLRAVYGFLLAPGVPMQLTGALSRGLGGRTATSTLPLSRQGASPDFTAAMLEVSVQHALPASLLLAVTGRAQTSFDSPLMLAEQVSLDGVDALSSFADGTLSVDQGVTLRIELSRPLTLTIAGQGIGFSPYLFGAGGWGELVMPTVVEHRDIGAGSAGVGLRTDAGIAGLIGSSLALEFARKFSDLPTVPDGYRANISLVLRF